MGDHTEKLRQIARDLRELSEATLFPDDLDDAAAEIERLTARVAELEDLIDSPIKGLRRTIRLQREMIEDVDHKRQTWRDRAEAAEAERDRLREALAWYGEQSRLARLVHSGGDAGRHALASDGGKRARAALGEGE